MKFSSFLLLLFAPIVLFACAKPASNQPASVVVDAGNPLTCNLLPEPKTIERLTAVYSCAAPGAYLESVNTQDMTAEYFTTNTQGDTVTFGPKTYPLIEIN